MPSSLLLSARTSVGVVGTTRQSASRKTSTTTTTKKTTTTTTRAVMTPPERVFTKDLKRPDENGRYGGVYGGKYVPETLIPALMDLEREYEK